MIVSADLESYPAPPGGVPFILRRASDPQSPAVLMLHGLHGDERVMWVLESVLPLGGLHIALRGVQPAAGGGFQWAEPAGERAALEDFQDAVQAISRTVEALETEQGISPEPFYLMGFSQGAAAAFACAASGALRPSGIIALAGFLPIGDVDGLQGVPIYWGHGVEDLLVPLTRALQGADRLRAAGAQVTFCEAQVGHKLGAACARGLREWFQDQRAQA